MKRIFFRDIMKGLCLFLIICIVIGKTNYMFLNKGIEIRFYSPVGTFGGFYDMQENSVDVLFMGTSHSYNSFSPQQLYAECGVRSYNLGSSMQTFPLNYYWLKEALRFQSPQFVVLDTYALFRIRDNVLNMTEPQIRQAVDYMKWSVIKRDMIDQLCEIDSSMWKESFYIPMLRFHDRWETLDEDDLSRNSLTYLKALKGYKPAFKEYGDELLYKPFDLATYETDEVAEVLPLMEEYLQKIADLCESEGVELVLVRTPYIGANLAEYNVVLNFAQKNGLDFLDYNEQNLYQQIGYNFPFDATDSSHASFTGAQKLTSHIGQFLMGKGVKTVVSDLQYEEDREYYETITQLAEITHIADAKTYINKIKESGCTLFVAEYGESDGVLLGNILEQSNIEEDYLYCGIIEDEEGTWWKDKEKVISDGKFRNGKSRYNMSGSDNECSIIIDGKEVAVNKQGVNIVVYDNVSRQVLDSVCIDESGSLYR